MQKQGLKLESTRKTEQDRSCWNFFTMVKVNGQRSKSMINDLVKVKIQWLTWQCDVALRLTWQYMKWSRRVVARESMGTGVWGAWQHVRDTGGAWSACSWGRNFSRRMWCSFWPFLVGIGCSIALCLCFGSWMSRTMISESCRDYGRDSGDLILTVTTGWRRGQRKNARDVHRNQKVRGMTLIPC